MLQAHEKGRSSLQQFVTERLQVPCTTVGGPVAPGGVSADQVPQLNPEGIEVKQFYDKLSKLALRNFATMSKPRKRSVKGHTFTLRYTRDLFHKMTIIAMSRGLDIDNILQYPRGPMPYSLATESGGLVKTSKSALMHELEKLVEPEEAPNMASSQVIILDAMALIQSLKLAKNATFADWAEMILKIIIKHGSQSSNTTHIHWMCDTYPVISIKNVERSTRMMSAEGSFATTITSPEQCVDKQLKKALRH